VEYILELSERVTLEGLSLLGDVYPKTTLSADGARSFDDESKHVSRFRRSGEVDITPGHIGRSVILQRK
jgi:hypothetical protein